MRSLTDFGFCFVSQEMTDDSSAFNEWSEEYWAENKWIKPIGGGRRGQQYYLLIPADLSGLQIYASKPDGDGAECDIDLEFMAKVSALLGGKK